MLIPLFHSVPLCSPKKASKGYTNGHLHFICTWKLCATLLLDACSQKKEASSFVFLTNILKPLCAWCFWTYVHWSNMYCRVKQFMKSQGMWNYNTYWWPQMFPFHFGRGWMHHSGDWNWFWATAIIQESGRRGWQVLRQQIADHSPKVLRRIRCSIPLVFSKEKKKKEKIVPRFRPSHVASNFNQKLVQVCNQKRREEMELLQLTKEKDWLEAGPRVPQGIRIISLFSCCKDRLVRLECLFRWFHILHLPYKKKTLR